MQRQSNLLKKKRIHPSEKINFSLEDSLDDGCCAVSLQSQSIRWHRSEAETVKLSDKGGRARRRCGVSVRTLRLRQCAEPQPPALAPAVQDGPESDFHALRRAARLRRRHFGLQIRLKLFFPILVGFIRGGTLAM